MRIVRHTDAAAFAERTRPFLVAAEAQNCLLLGMADGLRAAAAGGADLGSSGMPVRGVNARADVADVFATLWSARTADAIHRERDLRIYELSSVVAPRPAPGHLRAAGVADHAIVDAWARRFVADTGVSDGADSVARDARRAIAGGRLVIWDDDGPVAMAARTGTTPTGVRVSLVYTPPERRGRGYASSCVAALSASLLAAGRKRCFLFTDLANPTSNHVYMTIGYRPVCDVREYRFTRP